VRVLFYELYMNLIQNNDFLMSSSLPSDGLANNMAGSKGLKALAEMKA